MLPHIESLALLYVRGEGYNWYWGDRDKYYARERDEVPIARRGKYPMKYGDVIRDGTYYIVGMDGQLIADEFVGEGDPPHPMLEVWKVNPETGHFMYSDYWDFGTTYIESVWVSHGRFRSELLNNFTIARDKRIVAFYTYCMIFDTKFYIYIYTKNGAGKMDIKCRAADCERVKQAAFNYFERERGIYDVYLPEMHDHEIDDQSYLYPIALKCFESNPQVLWLCIDGIKE